MSALSLHQVSHSSFARKAPSAPRPLRLTRRGRIVLIGAPLVLLAVVLLSLSGFFNSPAKASDSAAGLAVTPTVTVTVQPGQSLWAIAGTVAPDRDARDVVADIVQLNNLGAGSVIPGQQLFVPTR
ncbi:LysM peptidoglycan-binding domain-containing protein [Pseudarthrobacter phenanthrenivorans]|uniref:LysM domain-containing protein n=1 Tax=Pseudarthrobacter phenanthrenivorans TaxID=361575 RepID=A0A0B4CTV7_PSEPS|nr:LysM peptidoglycan-binding domain-containing protein [Pseudarthrobacter phenanthrenivorans]KIC64664.1 hypothetical protein RM50_17460 [Pseudarthrobacter phenanthrenivorans]